MNDGPPTPRVLALAAVVSNDPAHPWERQASESEADFELFRRYRDRAKPRGRVIGPGMGDTATCFRLFQDQRWTERVAAWDRYLERIELEVRAAGVAKKAAERTEDHLTLLHEAFELAYLEVRKLLNVAQSSDMPNMKPADLVKLIDRVVSLERTIHGEATEIVQHKGPDLSALPLEDLDKLAEILERAGTSEPGTDPH